MIHINVVAIEYGIKLRILTDNIRNGLILAEDDYISNETYQIIKEQKERYIGLNDFIKSHREGRFNPDYSKERNKYIDFLEENSYFGVERYHEGILLGNRKEDIYFILKEDQDILNYNSKVFFEDYGYSDREIVERILQANTCITAKAIRDYIQYQKIKYTPSFRDAVRTLMLFEDISQLTSEDIVSNVLNEKLSPTARGHITSILNYAKTILEVKYGVIQPKPSDSKGALAYSLNDYISLAEMIFSEDSDRIHSLTEKALKYHMYAEAWLFLSMHYICGWRPSDICKCWSYPMLKENNYFNLTIETLRKDILNNKISESLYAEIANYCITKVARLNRWPKKTAESASGSVKAFIPKDLESYFGKLILIAEVHHIENGEGYMKPERIHGYYCNWVHLRSFLGNQYIDTFGEKNLRSDRLIKSFLQNLDDTVRKNGGSPFEACMIAAMARNHANINTTIGYIRDRGLSQENADTVVYLMMQRGVTSVYLYILLMNAFPDAFGKLSTGDQTYLMSLLDINALEIELVSSEHLAGIELRNKCNVFNKREVDNALKNPLDILTSMFNICNGHGPCKDTGVGCILTSLGHPCAYPEKGGIASLCPYHVFLKDGIPSLVEVIKHYIESYHRTGFEKYKIILMNRIIPRYKRVLYELFKYMNQEEVNVVKSLIEGSIDE